MIQVRYGGMIISDFRTPTGVTWNAGMALSVNTSGGTLELADGATGRFLGLLMHDVTPQGLVPWPVGQYGTTQRAGDPAAVVSGHAVVEAPVAENVVAYMTPLYVGTGANAGKLVVAQPSGASAVGYALGTGNAGAVIPIKLVA